MKKKTINFNWPATLSFSAENSNENERFSRGKLKVFYKGETADHRYFSDEFSEELIKSLPYTPIVSHYDVEKDDFVGHATEQDIYGIVDPCGEIGFETDESGITWAVCDTVYYTERPDKVGEIAKKIEGHSQSLELDPSTVKYVINYDDKRHFKNIEFTAGHFVGVSVLGKDQKPAFTGSAFFASDEQFEEKMRILKEYCEKQKNDANQSGGNEMNLQEFMTLSWGDKAQKVVEALNAEYENEYWLYVVDFFDDCVIARMYSLLDGKDTLNRVKYTIDEDGVVTLGSVNEVHVVYEDVPDNQPSATESDQGVTQAEEQSNVAEETIVAPEEVTPAQPEVTEPENHADLSEDVTNHAEENIDITEETSTDAAPSSEETATIAAQDVNADVTEMKEVGADNGQKQEESSSSASLTDCERAEFEALKREKKERLIDSYKESLSEEEYDSFVGSIDSVTFEELETALLKIYHDKAESENHEDEEKPTSRVFSLSALIPNNEKENNSLGSLIKHYLG